MLVETTSIVINFPMKRNSKHLLTLHASARIFYIVSMVGRRSHLKQWTETYFLCPHNITLTLMLSLVVNMWEQSFKPFIIEFAFPGLQREGVLTVSQDEPLLLLGHVLLLHVLLPQSVLLHRFTAVVDLLLTRLRFPHPILQLELPVVTFNVLPYVLQDKRDEINWLLVSHWTFCTAVDNNFFIDWRTYWYFPLVF